jgi:dienelactone hydrolase
MVRQVPANGDETARLQRSAAINVLIDREWMVRSTCQEMIHYVSWPEWIAFLLGMIAAVQPTRRSALVALAVVAACWIFGTAGLLLFPAAVGSLSLLLLLKSGRRWRMAGRFLATGGVLFSAFLCVIFPVPTPPRLTGPHPVGSLQVELPAATPSPSLVVRIWYPASHGGKEPRSRWLPDPALAPDPPFHRIAHAFSNSVRDSKPLETPAKLPVIFYEHSWTGHRAENVAQAEALASHGFVIVAVDHPGQAERVRYADGTIVPSHLPEQLDLSTEKAVSEFEKLAEECLRQRQDEIGTVRRALVAGVVPKLAGRLELEKVGIFGFSFGGTCALRVCSEDPSFVAGANEDGFYIGDGKPLGPFLFFDQQMPEWLLQPASSDEGAEEALTRRSELRIRAALVGPDRERVILDGTRHESFCDRIFTCRISRLARTGSRPALEVHQLVTSRLADFFTAHLTHQRPAGE